MTRQSNGAGLTRDQRRHRGMTEAAIRAPENAGPLRFAFADPPYPGQARRHYGAHEDYAGEVDHAELVARLMADYGAGWVLCTGARMLPDVLPLCPEGVRVLAWVKPMTPMKPGVSVDFGWEPVLLWGGRRRPRRAPMVRDWLSCSPEQWTFTGKAPDGAVIGMKPQAFCRWCFDCLGARPERGDTLDDLFPGSGAVARAWTTYYATPDLFSGAAGEQTERFDAVA